MVTVRMAETVADAVGGRVVGDEIAGAAGAVDGPAVADGIVDAAGLAGEGTNFFATDFRGFTRI